MVAVFGTSGSDRKRQNNVEIVSQWRTVHTVWKQHWKKHDICVHLPWYLLATSNVDVWLDVLGLHWVLWREWVKRYLSGRWKETCCRDCFLWVRLLRRKTEKRGCIRFWVLLETEEGRERKSMGRARAGRFFASGGKRDIFSDPGEWKRIYRQRIAVDWNTTFERLKIIFFQSKFGKMLFRVSSKNVPLRFLIALLEKKLIFFTSDFSGY